MARNLLITVALILLYCSQAWAQTVELWGHVASKHFVDSRLNQPWCEINPGLGLNIGLNEHVGVEAGFFENSYCHQSEYYGIDLRTDKTDEWGVGLLVGRLHGYRNIEPVWNCGHNSHREWECEKARYEEREEVVRWGLVPYVRWHFARAAILGTDAVGLSFRVSW